MTSATSGCAPDARSSTPPRAGPSPTPGRGGRPACARPGVPRLTPRPPSRCGAETVLAGGGEPPCPSVQEATTTAQQAIKGPVPLVARAALPRVTPVRRPHRVETLQKAEATRLLQLLLNVPRPRARTRVRSTRGSCLSARIASATTTLGTRLAARPVARAPAADVGHSGRFSTGGSVDRSPRECSVQLFVHVWGQSP